LRIKIGAFGGLVLASPIIFWQFWRFITPGLRSAEKRYAVPFVRVHCLVPGGCASRTTSSRTPRVLEGHRGPELRQIYNPNQYLGLILLMMALFGITFEFPVVLVSLELLGVVTPKKLLSWWRWAVIGIALAAAIFTPSSDRSRCSPSLCPDRLLLRFHRHRKILGR